MSYYIMHTSFIEYNKTRIIIQQQYKKKDQNLVRLNAFQHNIDHKLLNALKMNTYYIFFPSLCILNRIAGFHFKICISAFFLSLPK